MLALRSYRVGPTMADRVYLTALRGLRALGGR
jgi:hypothetical protein